MCLYIEIRALVSFAQFKHQILIQTQTITKKREKITKIDLRANPLSRNFKVKKSNLARQCIIVHIFKINTSSIIKSLGKTQIACNMPLNLVITVATSVFASLRLSAQPKPGECTKTRAASVKSCIKGAFHLAGLSLSAIANRYFFSIL